MDETKMEQQRIQEFLSNAAFIRHFEVLSVCQKQLQENKQNPENYQTLQDRINFVFAEKKENVGDEKAQAFLKEFNKMRQQMLAWCDAGELTKEKLAELYANSSAEKMLLDSWNPKPGNENEQNLTIVNEVLQYYINEQDKTEISITILPSALRGDALWEKAAEGQKIIAEELATGSLQHIKTIVRESWLYTHPLFAERMKKLLGEGIVFEDLPEEETDHKAMIQKLALNFNKQVMKEYLTTGKLPEIKKFTMTKEEFIKRYLK